VTKEHALKMSTSRMFIGGQAELLGCDESARARLDAGAVVARRAGRVVFSDPAIHACFEAALADVRARAQGFVAAPERHIVVSPRARVPDALLIRVSALVVPGGGPVRALLELQDLGVPAPVPGLDAELVSRAWGLTGAQARVAVAVAGGRSPADVAADHGISVRTVRCHLSTVFGKVGVSRQPELVRRLAGHPGLLLRVAVSERAGAARVPPAARGR
jgi:DNA-binding CsgD family transcriptional regulator